MNFNGRVIVVTGAARGLGQAYALHLAARGARLVLNNRGGAAAALAEQIGAAGGVAVAESSDVSAAGAAASIVALALARFGRLDALIHNAGIIEAQPVAELSEADFLRVFEVNTLSALRLTQAALPVMRRQRHGRLVYTTSTAGLYGNAGLAAYGMAKGALLGLMRAVDAEESGNGIRANAICPTALTRMTAPFLEDAALHEALSPARIAPVVAWLASAECGFGARVLIAEGGWVRSALTLQTAGAEFGVEAVPSAEEIAALEQGIVALREPRGFDSAQAHSEWLMAQIRARAAGRDDKAAIDEGTGP